MNPIPFGIRWLLRSQRIVRSGVSYLEALQSGLFLGLIREASFLYCVGAS